jgi:hypothetical protein
MYNILHMYVLKCLIQMETTEESEGKKEPQLTLLLHTAWCEITWEASQ